MFLIAKNALAGQANYFYLILLEMKVKFVRFSGMGHFPNSALLVSDTFPGFPVLTLNKSFCLK